MAEERRISKEDLTIDKFLEKFTYQSDATPNQHIALPDDTFFVSASILQLTKQIGRLVAKL